MRMALVALVIVLLDQVVKQLVLHVLPLPVWLIPDDIGLQVSMNPGVAFSFPIQGVFAIVLTIIIVAVLLYYYLQHIQKKRISYLVFGCILGGALGNLLDRFFYGAVVDYIRIYSYPAFNIADMAITVGFLLFVIYLDRMSIKKFSRF